MGSRRLHPIAKAAGVAVTLVMVALGGTAFACTTFVGRVSVTGDDASTATSVSVGYNKFDTSDGMYYCAADNTKTRNTQGGAVAKYQGLATITVQPTTACTGTGHARSNNGFPGGTYDVNFVHRRGGTAPFKCENNVCTFNPVADCMSPRLSEVQNIGTMNIDSAGYSLNTSSARGSRTYRIPYTPNADTASVQSAVCVSDTTATYANEIPIRVL